MTADAPSRPRRPASQEEPAPSPTDPASRSLTEQIDRVVYDLAAYRRLAQRGDALARGAALAAAHGALALATAPLSSPPKRNLRRTALDGAVPALVGAGLGHIADLVAAALALEHHPISLTRTWGEPQ